MPDVATQEEAVQTRPVVNLEAVVAKFIELRDLKAKLKAEAEAQIAPVQAAMDKIEGFLLKHMTDNGSTALKTAAGTAYTSEKTTVSVADWDSFFGFVKEQELWPMLNHAANKTVVQEYAATHGDLPPGLNYRVERTVGIRRA